MPIYYVNYLVLVIDVSSRACIYPSFSIRGNVKDFVHIYLSLMSISIKGTERLCAYLSLYHVYIGALLAALTSIL